MKIIITEEQKKKLFIPRRLSGENSRWNQWNKEQPVKDGIRINQYTDDGIKTGYWEYNIVIGDGIRHKITSKGSYVDGLKEGIWEEYYDNGNLRSKGLYTKGKQNGVWVWYKKNGDLFFKTKY